MGQCTPRGQTHSASFIRHTKAGCAVAAQEDGLLPLNQISMEFYNRVGYHDYEGIALNTVERERLVKDLGTHPRADSPQSRPADCRRDCVGSISANVLPGESMRHPDRRTGFRQSAPTLP